jgi:hypothetical protein
VEREREKRVYMQERRRRRGGNEGDAAGRNNTVNNIFHPALFPRARPEEYIHIPPLSLLFLWHVLDVVRKTSREINRKFFSLLFLSPPLRPFATKHKQQRDSSSSNSRQQQQHIYTLLLLCVCVY